MIINILLIKHFVRMHVSEIPRVSVFGHYPFWLLSHNFNYFNNVSIFNISIELRSIQLIHSFPWEHFSVYTVYIL